MSVDMSTNCVDSTLYVRWIAHAGMHADPVSSIVLAPHYVTELKECSTWLLTL